MLARTPVALALAVTTLFPSLIRAADPHEALARAKEATGGARWDAARTNYVRASPSTTRSSASSSRGAGRPPSPTTAPGSGSTSERAGSR
jgi:hypothetical protein